MAIKGICRPNRWIHSAVCVALGLFAPSAIVCAQSTYDPQYAIATLAGSAKDSGSSDGTGSAAQFDRPLGVAVDSAGNVYVADSINSTIRKVTSAGVVTTLAGMAGSAGTADGTGSAARFMSPTGVAVDGSGNVYVADSSANSIRKITSAGVVTTLAGGTSGSNDGTGTAAQFSKPSGIALDASGNLYVADTGNDTIRMVAGGAVVTTLAGSAGNSGSADGTGSAARFNGPIGIAADSSGNLYVADTLNDTIRKVATGAVVTTLVGTAGSAGSSDPFPQFNAPSGIAVDGNGNLYVADTGNHEIRMITGGVTVTTLAGSAGAQGSANGTGSAALFNMPFGIAAASNGTIYIGDSENDAIRLGMPAKPTSPTIAVQPVSESVNAGVTSTLSVAAAGVPLPTFQWQLNGVDVDPNARDVSGTTSATLVIGDTEEADAGIYTVVVSNASGSVTSNPVAIALSAPTTYSVATLAGFGVAGGPNGVAVDSEGNIYVSFGDALEKVSPSGTPTLVAGSLTVPGSADGAGAAASFNHPTGIATDESGNIYVADSGNNSIRKVTPAGAVTTFAGLVMGNADGIGVAAQFNNPIAVAVDHAGNVFVADVGNNELREIAPDGTTTTLLTASAFTFGVTQSGGPSYQIKGVAVDGTGTPYVGVSVSQHLGLGTPIYGVSVFKVSGADVLTEQYRIFPTDEFPQQNPGDGALAIDIDGNAYTLGGNALFAGANLISSLAFQGAEGPQTAVTPLAVAVDSSGRVYVANAIDEVLEVATPVGTPPNIATQPTGGTIAYGEDSTLSVGTSGTPAPTYQWRVDGVPIAGATSASYSTSQPGTYTVAVTNSSGTVTSSPAVLTAATRLLNISSRASVGTNANVEIAGFVISGPPGTQEQVLIRGAGPSLAQFGVTGFLANPILTLFDSKGNQVATNTGWNTASNASAIASTFAITGAFAFPLDSADSAILTSLPPGSYTAEITGAGNSTGVALAEVYEVASGDPELINISTRAFVNSGMAVVIGGFVVKGSQPAKVLVRAIGPTLAQFGVSGALAQPSLSVVDSHGTTVATNAGWSSNSNPAAIATEMVAVGAFALPNGSADSALLLTLAPGSYTAVVSGVGGTTGVALVEVYQAP